MGRLEDVFCTYDP